MSLRQSGKFARQQGDSRKIRGVFIGCSQARETILSMKYAFTPVIVALLLGLSALNVDLDCFHQSRPWKVKGACVGLHVWHYLPLGVFLASLAIALFRLSNAGRNARPIQYCIITVGYLAALSARAAHSPVIYHPWSEWPRFDVGLALVLLLIAPLSRTWRGTLFSCASCALILHHWFG